MSTNALQQIQRLEAENSALKLRIANIYKDLSKKELQQIQRLEAENYALKTKIVNIYKYSNRVHIHESPNNRLKKQLEQQKRWEDISRPEKFSSDEGEYISDDDLSD